MDTKLYRKTYPYICSSCGGFSHTKFDYCDTCGEKDSLREARKEDYKDHQKNK